MFFQYSIVNESEEAVNWELLARANTHPLRISIVEVLGLDGGRTLSPKDLSFELWAPLSTVNYHVTELAKAGLIELIDQRQVRGAIEHFYRLIEVPKQPARRRARKVSHNGHRRRGAARRARVPS